MREAAAVLIGLCPGVGLGRVGWLGAVPDAFFVVEVFGLLFEHVPERETVSLGCRKGRRMSALVMVVYLFDFRVSDIPSLCPSFEIRL